MKKILELTAKGYIITFSGNPHESFYAINVEYGRYRARVAVLYEVPEGAFDVILDGLVKSITDARTKG